MLKYDGYLICSDCDGTLTDHHQNISEENAEAIRYFQKNGGIFTVATGRAPHYITDYKNQFTPNAPIVALNGTSIYDLDKDESLFDLILDDHAGDVPGYANENCDFIKTVHIVQLHHTYIWEKDKRIAFRDVYPHVSRPWYKILFLQNSENETLILQRDLMEKFSHRYQFDRSWTVGLEMHSKESGKGECVGRLKAFLDRPIHTTICVGDYENDISMVEAADIGCAVANAADSVKAVADRILASNNENAIAQLIYSL